jgi:hypothetical protein
MTILMSKESLLNEITLHIESDASFVGDVLAHISEQAKFIREREQRHAASLHLQGFDGYFLRISKLKRLSEMDAVFLLIPVHTLWKAGCMDSLSPCQEKSVKLLKEYFSKHSFEPLFKAKGLDMRFKDFLMSGC